MKKITFSDAILSISVILSILIFTWVYPKLYVSSCVDLGLSKDKINTYADSIFTSLGYNLNECKSNVHMESDNAQYKYLQNRFGINYANQIVKSDSIPVFWWSCNFLVKRSKQDSVNIVFGGEGTKSRQDGHVDKVSIHFDLKGRLIMLKARDAGGLWKMKKYLSNIDKFTYAEHLAQRILGEDFSEWSFSKKDSFNRSEKNLSVFNWKRNKRITGEDAAFSVILSGNRVVDVDKHFSIPSKYTREKKFSFYLTFFLFVVGILSIILFIQRLRLDLIDLKAGIFPAVLVVVIWFIKYFTTVFDQTLKLFSAMNILGYVMTSLFIGGIMWVMFSVGESLCREVWPEKLNSMDFLRRMIFSREVSRSVVEGISLGFIAAGVIAAFQYVFVINGLAAVSILPNLETFYSHNIPWLYGLHNIYISLFFITSLCLISMPFIKKYFKWSVIGYVILVVLAAPVSMGLPTVSPEQLNLVVGVIVTTIFIYSMYRYDIIAALIGGVSLPVIFTAYSGVVNSNTAIQIHGIALLSLLAVFLLFALLIKNREANPDKPKEFVPGYLQRIYERERQHSELEIARNVQLRFLPQSVPDFKEVDIASFCIPAMETGGDYYDFIPLGPDKLGIAIGDVSGKGISASFYMTLTKGFLLSQAKLNFSPKEVLINMNELFYENVQRGIFISMIYGIFDFSKSTITVARAGHNPMIIFRKAKGVTEEMKSQGIGLGLEKGEVFSRTIEDIVVSLSKGDICFFYTDGLNEALNVHGEEFGEMRIQDIISSDISQAAKEILHNIQTTIGQFSIGTEQHDDMTAVIVKMS